MPAETSVLRTPRACVSILHLCGLELTSVEFEQATGLGFTICDDAQLFGAYKVHPPSSGHPRRMGCQFGGFW